MRTGYWKCPMGSFEPDTRSPRRRHAPFNTQAGGASCPVRTLLKTEVWIIPDAAGDQKLLMSSLGVAGI